MSELLLLELIICVLTLLLKGLRMSTFIISDYVVQQSEMSVSHQF